MIRIVPPALVALLALAALAPSAHAQAYIDPPCAAAETPRFEDGLQALWYRRFWTGQCQDLSVLRCLSGRPYWNDVVRKVVARAPEPRRAAVGQAACGLGRRIGFEWTRPMAERRISTPDLRGFDAALEAAPDIEAGLAAVVAKVAAKIGG